LTDIHALAPFINEGLAMITPSRRAKAQAFKNAEDKLHSVACGLLLRKILNVKCDRQIFYNDYGKPFMKNAWFSLSHGGDFSVLAVHCENVGVDVEKISEINPMAAKKMFTPQELSWIGDDATRFCTLWAKKESILKADGRGFSLPPKSFDMLEKNHPWQTEIFFHKNHVIACTAKETFQIKWNVVPIKQLLE